MNTNRLIKISLLLFMSMIAIWASDGNVTINDFENFKEIISVRVDALEKNIDRFYAVAGTLITILLSFFGYFTYRYQVDSGKSLLEIKTDKDEIRSTKNAISTYEQETENILQRVQKLEKQARTTVDDIKEHYEKSNILQLPIIQQLSRLDDTKKEFDDVLSNKGNEIDDKGNEVDDEFYKSKIINKLEEAKDQLNYFIQDDWRIFLSTEEIKSVEDKFLNNKLPNKNKDIFINQVFRSFSLGIKEKLRVANAFCDIGSSQYLALIGVFIEEILKFQELEREYGKDTYQLIYETLKGWKGFVCALDKIKEEDMWHNQEAYLEKSIEMYLDDEQKYNVISVMFANDLYNQRKYSKSIKILEGLIGDSLYNDKVSIESHLLLSKAYVSVDDFQNALKVAENCIVVDIDINIKIEFYGLMLYVYIRQKMKIKANETAKELKKLKENHYELLEYMEYLITVNGFEDASKIFEKDTMEFDSGEKYRVVYYWLSYIVNICLNKEANIYEERFKEYLNELPNELDWNTKDIENWLKDAELSYKQKAMVDDTIKLIKDKK